MKLQLQLSHIITILSLVALLGGFYYTTQFRLSALEDVQSESAEKISKLEKRINGLQKRIKKAGIK